MRHLLPVTALLLAGAAWPALAANVGITAAVNQDARGTPPNQAVRTLSIGDDVFFNERIDTNPVGLLQILLADGTAFTVGPNASLVIDRFVYDPDAGTAEVSATLTKGVFRFIGGKTSKTPNGVRLNSPVGTIGIRGAVVDVAVEGPGKGSVSMVFGREVTLRAPGGQVNRIYEPGYSIVVETGADGRERRQVVRTPPSAANQIQTALAGRPGTTGGASVSPTDTVVATSRVDAENSARPPAVNDPPIPQPRPQEQDRSQSPNEVREAVREAGFDVAQADVVETVNETPGAGPGPDPDPDPTPNPDPTPGPDPEPDPGPDPEPDPGPGATALPVRVLTAGATYTTNNGQVIQNPGAVGLVGGSADEDRTVTLQVPAEGTSGSGPSNRGSLVLPVYNTDPDREEFSSELVTSGAFLGTDPLVGLAYVGGTQFAAYQLSLDAEFTRPVYALYGTPVADTAVFGNGDVRTYEFSDDIFQNVPVPFFNGNALGADFGGATIGKFYMVEPRNGLANASPSLFQTWLLIDGEGAAQRSAVGVNVSNVFPNNTSDGPLVASFGRRGSYRALSTDNSFQYGGTVQTLGAPGGGNEFFGTNGQYLVLAGDSEANDFFSDSSSTRGVPSTQFSSFHVLNLSDETPIDQTTTLGFGTTKPATITGFAAGTVESIPRNGVGNSFSFASSGDPNDFSITFDAATNRLGGELDVQYRNSGTGLHVPFGDGVNGNTNGGPSSYVNDGTFGARDNGNRNRTNLRTLDPNTGVETVFRQVRDTNARTYLVAGESVTPSSFVGNSRLCDCDFLSWGWWGTQIRGTSDVANAPNREDVRAGVHLGTWVAGDVTTNLALATQTGTATYQGTAVGSVVSRVDGVTENYLARADMGMLYDFGPRSGRLEILGLDGRDFIGTVGGTTGDVPQALFGGNLEQVNGGDATGIGKGAFVNDGPVIAGGVIGNFDLASPTTNTNGDTVWSASGVFAGARLPPF